MLVVYRRIDKIQVKQRVKIYQLINAVAFGCGTLLFT